MTDFERSTTSLRQQRALCVGLMDSQIMLKSIPEPYGAIMHVRLLLPPRFNVVV